VNPTVHTDDARFFELLERWVNGDFTRHDEQELIALTRTDDFRREAWEGFVSAPEWDHSALLQSLKQRLQQPKKHPGVFNIRFYMAAAAALALLVTAVFFFQKTEKQLEPASVATQMPDSMSTGRPAPPTEIATAPNSSADILTQSAPSRVANKPGAGQAGSSLNEPEIAGVFDAEKKPIIPESPAEVTSTESVSGDDQPTVVAAESKQKMVLPPDASSSSNSYPSSPKSQSNLPVKDEIARKETNAKKRSVSPAGPENGWEAFSNYLRQNARLPAAAKNNNISGNVSLQFNIDDQGKAQDIQVIKGLGYGCDELAIQLIQAYKWVQGTQKSPMRVEVPFVR
jgi:TonB family protein